MALLSTIFQWTIKLFSSQSIAELKNYQALIKSSPQMILNRVSLLLIEIIEEYQVIGRIFPLIIFGIIFGIVFLLILCTGLIYTLHYYGHVSFLQVILILLVLLGAVLFFIFQKVKRILKNKNEFLHDTLNELEQDCDMMNQLTEKQ